MNPLLEQFLSESREFSQGIGEKLMQLEQAPADQGLIQELFRLVHTLKGNSGLFTFPEMTRVLHAGEDLLGMVREGRIAYSRDLADRLLEAVDFVGLLCADIEATERIDASRVEDSVRLAESLRGLMPAESFKPTVADTRRMAATANIETPSAVAPATSLFHDLPEATRAHALSQSQAGDLLHWLCYTPMSDCFFQGDDPLFLARQTPGLLWGKVRPHEPLPALADLDTYRCVLTFDLLTAAPREELMEHFRYVPDQVTMVEVDPRWLAPERAEHASAVNPPGSSANQKPSELRPRPLPVPGSDALPAMPIALSHEEPAALEKILSAQQHILMLDGEPESRAGRLQAVALVLANLAQGAGDPAAAREVKAALAECLSTGRNDLLLLWIEASQEHLLQAYAARAHSLDSQPAPANTISPPGTDVPEPNPAKMEDGIKFGRRSEDALTKPKSLKVDQAKIDRLMNLIGELMVEKNALPFLAQRAEDQYGVRELSREIKGQYASINRIVDEMQDAIMQVRMLAVSVVFQRFPRLVRDLSRKLGKDVQLVLEGEQTEADKNIIESLADPLIHIVRNSLDHGLETPAVRRACGKRETGTLSIRAAQEADRVVIEIRDDGKGIDPAVIKRKAYEKGLIDEAALERIDDREAVNLIFAAGLSTAEVVSDLSGRGVGMDVVRSAVEKINGTVVVDSQVGKGTTLRISLPLSMAVTQVMVIQTDGQLFGVPMDNVVETVRVPRSAVHSIKQSLTTVLRGRIVPLKALNTILGIPANPLRNPDDELAVLLVQAGGQVLGLLVDGFKETIGLIQKPLAGFLSGLSAYSGSALMGDGSVLMILNVREIV